MQTASILTGLPFTLILLCIIYTLYVGLSQEADLEEMVDDRLREVRDDHRLDEAISSAQKDIMQSVTAESRKA